MASMTIDGKRVDSGETFDVLNPATGEVVDIAPECSKEQLDEAMEAAARAFHTSWRHDLDQRRAVMYACAEALSLRAW